MKEEKINGLDDQTFLKKYSHTQSSVSEIGLNWHDLVEIFEDYKSIKQDLGVIASKEHQTFQVVPGAYIVRYRVKDPEHLIDKIIRKKIDDGEIVTKENYKTRFDDLIGFRILHLFKDNWKPIHEYIKENYELKETPIVYYRQGDSQEFLKQCRDMGVEPKEKQAGYRSIHYVAKKYFLGHPYTFEIQVRTIIEDAWSEIDHLIRYPNQTQDELLNQYLLLFNMVAGAADEMGTYLMLLKQSSDNAQRNLQDNEEKHNKALEELRAEVSKLKNVNTKQRQKIDTLVARLEQQPNSLSNASVFPVDYFETIERMSQIQTPSSSIASSSSLGALQASLEKWSKISDAGSKTTALGLMQSITMPKVGTSLTGLDTLLKMFHK